MLGSVNTGHQLTSGGFINNELGSISFGSISVNDYSYVVSEKDFKFSNVTGIGDFTAINV